MFAGAQRFLFQVATEKIGKDLRHDVFKEIINKDVAFFDSRKTGDLSKLLSSLTFRGCSLQTSG